MAARFAALQVHIVNSPDCPKTSTDCAATSWDVVEPFQDSEWIWQQRRIVVASSRCCRCFTRRWWTWPSLEPKAESSCRSRAPAIRSRQNGHLERQASSSSGSFRAEERRCYASEGGLRTALTSQVGPVAGRLAMDQNGVVGTLQPLTQPAMSQGGMAAGLQPYNDAVGLQRPATQYVVNQGGMDALQPNHATVTPLPCTQLIPANRNSPSFRRPRTQEDLAHPSIVNAPGHQWHFVNRGVNANGEQIWMWMPVVWHTVARLRTTLLRSSS